MSASALVRQARAAAGLTQAELGARLGVSQPVIARLESATSIRRTPHWSAPCGRRAMVWRCGGAAGPATATATVDLSQLQERLALTPDERLRLFTRSQQNLAGLAGARGAGLGEPADRHPLDARGDPGRGGRGTFVVIGGIAAVRWHGSAQATFDAWTSASAGDPAQPSGRSGAPGPGGARSSPPRRRDAVGFVSGRAHAAPGGGAGRWSPTRARAGRARPAGRAAPVHGPAPSRRNTENSNSDGLTVPVASIEDLITMKRAAGRPRILGRRGGGWRRSGTFAPADEPSPRGAVQRP